MADQQGERVDVRNGRPANHTEQDHHARYVWAAHFVRGDVLDVACGTGHGSEVLTAGFAKVVGIDNNPDAIKRAQSRLPTSQFLLAAVPPIPYPDSSFDAVVCFETVEHIEDDKGLLSELRRVLNWDGTLVLSTPNKDVTSPDGPPTNPWHVREYRLEDLRELVSNAGFTNVEVLAQGATCARGRLGRWVLRIVARFPVLCRPGRWWDRLAHGDGKVMPWRDPRWKPTYWVLRARRGEAG